MSTSQKIAGVVILLFFIVGCFLLFTDAIPMKDSIDGGEQVFCTEEAKQCPDGSYVGRSGPRCEFSACPTLHINSSWKENVDNPEISFFYPKKLVTTKYVHDVDWPPQVVVSQKPFSCVSSGGGTSGVGQTEVRVLNNRSYCITVKNEGAAGSTYSQYTYMFEKNNKTVILTFKVRATQCLNYDEPQKSECLKERSTVSSDIDTLIDQITDTVVIKEPVELI